MATNLRLQGQRTRSATPTINTQVGVDTATTHIRTTPASLTDLNTKYFDKTGNDSTGSGTAASPYLTAQKAIDEVVSAGGAFVYAGCQDSAIYEETIDLQGVYLVAVDGQAPTLKYPEETAFSVLDDFGQTVYCFLEWNGDLYAGTDNGVYKSTDGGDSFASWALAGKQIFDMVSWENSTGDNLYCANYTDSYVNKVTAAASASTFKDFSTEMTVRAVDLINGVFVVGGTAASTYSAMYYYKNSNATWYIIDESASGTSHQCTKIKYNSSLSSTTGFALGTFYVNSVLNTGCYSIVSDGNDITSYTLLQATPSITLTGDLSVSSTAVLFNGDNELWYNDNAKNILANFTLLRYFGDDSYYDSICNGVYIDVFGNLYFQVYEQNIIYSADNGSTWTELTTPTTASNFIYCFYESVGRLIAGDANKDSTIYIERNQVITTATNPDIEGFIIDGDNRSMYAVNTVSSSHYSPQVHYCNIKNSKNAFEDKYTSAAAYNIQFNNNKVFDNYNGVTIKGGDDAILFYNNLIYDNTYIGIELGGQTDLRWGHNTCVRNGINFKFAGGSFTVNASYTCNSIFHNATIADIYSNFDLKENAGFDYVKYNTKAGIGTVAVYTDGKRFIDDPLFVDMVNDDFNLKHIGDGYAYSSVYVKDGTGEASDDKALGCYDNTYAFGAWSYGVDYRPLINPNNLDEYSGLANYGSSINADGDFSDWCSNSGKIKRTFPFIWNPTSALSSWKYQAGYIQYLQTLENVVYRFGLTTDGTSWVPYESGTGTSAALSYTISASSLVLSPNQYQGYWIKINSVYHRIVSHPAKASGGTCVLVLEDPDGVLPTGAEAYSIDFILVKIDKKAPFTKKIIGYLPGDTNNIQSGYSLTLKEVSKE